MPDDTAPNNNRDRREYDHPTPADEVFVIGQTRYIQRMGVPMFPVGCGAESAADVREMAENGTIETQ